MSLVDLSFSALSRHVITVTSPSTVVTTGIFGIRARRQRQIRPSRTVLAIRRLAAASQS